MKVLLFKKRDIKPILGCLMANNLTALEQALSILIAAHQQLPAAIPRPPKKAAEIGIKMIGYIASTGLLACGLSSYSRVSRRLLSMAT